MTENKENVETVEEAEKEEEKHEQEEVKEDATEEVIEEKESEDDKYKRLLADFQNFKKRVEKEKSSIYSYANESIISDMLNILDNFQRGLEPECKDAKFKEGMELIFKQFKDCLLKFGLEEIEALGEDFDPAVHNALLMEGESDYESGKVSEVLSKGYTLKGKVIRPAGVKVKE